MPETTENFYADEMRFEHLKNALGEQDYSSLMSRLKERLSYSPVILFMGKTGVGKSSTCNALFGAEMFKVDDVAACTRIIQVEDLELPGKSLTLVDVPGVGENERYTQEYKDLYRAILTDGVKDKKGNRRQPDAIVFIFKADDRALQTELECYQYVLKNYLKKDQLTRVVLAINQADKIEPIRGNGGWDVELARPGTRQLENIDRKRKVIAGAFEVETNLVIDYSAGELYNLDRLLERIVAVLPEERIPFIVERALRQEQYLREDARMHNIDREIVLVSDGVIEEARRSLWDVAEDVGTVLFGQAGAAAVRLARDAKEVVYESYRAVTGAISAGVEKVGNFIEKGISFLKKWW